MISDEVVEAAAQAVADVWDGRVNDDDRELARIALRAAAPHLMAKAWDEGFEERVYDNPYRRKA